jgi:hypothetical protein
MKEEIELIDKIYRSPEFQPNTLGRYEVAVLQGVKNEIAWDALSDEQKMEFRMGDLVHKQKIEASDLVLKYERAVVDLGYEILYFLRETDSKFNDLANVAVISQQDIVLFRLRNMLYCELYSINKYRKLQYGGHVLFEEIIEPIFVELESHSMHLDYNLVVMKDKYRTMMDLYNREPYK